MYLSEILKIKYGKNQAKVVADFGYPIYGTSGIIGYAKNYLYNKPSILIGRKGSIENVRYIEKPFWCVDTTFYTIINEKIVIPKYIYYKLSLINFKRLDEGTTIPSLRTETLNLIELDIHPLTEQQHIVDTIGSIDDSIESNNLLVNKLNDLLWCNYLKFKNYVVNNEYEIKLMKDFVKITTGKKMQMQLHPMENIHFLLVL